MYETTESTEFDPTSYVAILEAARAIAVMQLDDQGGQGVDEDTREKARAFLRSEFEKWTDAPDEKTEGEEQPQ